MKNPDGVQLSKQINERIVFAERERLQELKLPPGWEVHEYAKEGARWVKKKNGNIIQIVIASCALEADGQAWTHLSISNNKRSVMPTSADLVYLKRHWLGDDRKAVMVLPEAKHHVNMVRNVLHLFSCVSADPLPEFSRMYGIL